MRKIFILLFIISLNLSAQTDTLFVKNNTLVLRDTKSVHFVKTKHETIYVGCVPPKHIYLRKQSTWMWVIYNDQKKVKYYLKFE